MTALKDGVAIVSAHELIADGIARSKADKA